jgi:Ca-activated chloride channel family protein
MNTPRFNPELNPDDPKWTAYILGELNDAERGEIERLLETSDEARTLVEELQLAAVTLKDELAPVGALKMSPEQRSVVLEAAQPAKRWWAVMMPMSWGPGLAAAAMVLIAVAIPAWMALSPGDRDANSAAVLPAVDQSAQVVAPGENPTPGSLATSTLQKRVEKAELETAPAAFNAVREADSGGKLDSNQQYKDVLEAVQAGLEPAAPKVEPAAPKNAPAEPALNDNVRQLIRISESEPSRDGASRLQEAEKAQGQVAQQGQQGQVEGPQGERRENTVVSGLAAGRGTGQGAGASVVGGTGTGVPGAVLGGRLAQVQGAVAAAPPPPPPPPLARAPEPAVAAARRADEVRRVAPNTEAYDRIVDNPFIRASQENFATFSIDVDTASYANVRRFLTQNQMPPRDAVRIEEMINYFNYDYARPSGNTPIAPNMEVASAPWNPANRLVRIGIKARELEGNRRPPSNLVFLIDVSGSMNTPNKLPLLKQGLKLLVDRLGENDMVSIVVYAGASGLVLPPTNGIRKETINQAIDSLYPGGSTNGASGIQLAYNQAVRNLIRGGVNRVILMTDGDFNVGITNQGDLTRLIEERAKSGVFLSVLGFGMGNIKDATLERLADRGNGNYAYIDNINEARKVLVEEMGGTLVTVAKDVKIQVDFNPGMVEAYRLIGYENRVLRTEDFNNDLKDAGDMGAGHTVTALFEVVPRGGTVPGPSVDPSKYVAPVASDTPRPTVSNSKEMLTLRVRYKQPDSDTSSRMDVPLVDRGGAFNRASSDFRFAASVASFGMILRDSPYRGLATLEWVLDIAEGSRGADRNGYRQEFITLVQKARQLR